MDFLELVHPQFIILVFKISFSLFLIDGEVKETFLSSSSSNSLLSFQDIFHQWRGEGRILKLFHSSLFVVLQDIL